MAVPLRFGRYEALFKIASGGMAEVFAARIRGEAGFEKLVAVKRMLPHLADDPDFVTMFLDEARLAAHIGSPHVAQTLDLGRADDGALYIIMELVVGVTLALFASGKIRASKKATKIFLIAMVGYAVFSLVNFGLMIFGVTDDPFGLRSAEIFGIPIGLLLGVLVVIMAAYSLVLDFDFIQQGVRNRAPKKYEWTGVFGIMVTVIWLYLEILRMLAIAQSSD